MDHRDILIQRQLAPHIIRRRKKVIVLQHSIQTNNRQMLGSAL